MGGELQVNIENVQSNKGQILIAIYDSPATYMQTAKAVELKAVPIRSTQPLAILFSGLKAGEYAISVVHDVNKNGILDTNIFGVPTEPYGFSNNIRPKFRSASWKESKFYFKDIKDQISIKLDTW